LTSLAGSRSRNNMERQR